ncbi:MAG TPA: TIGR01777 family oxidoreductase, partial [Cyclobacteriaceae bacterium]|nr:TIGR01777 family oxidoreductase [Cyclobacteriaceae bacterium]
IIHLAGTGVAEKRWTPERKKDILESRTKSGTLLFETLKNTRHKVKAVISASAIGYYGYANDPTPLSEASLPGDDFLARVVVDWEKSIDTIHSLGIRVAKIRIGIVLSEKGGALVEMAKPVKFGVGSPLGSGKQMVSWIHLDDLCGIFIQAIDDQSMTGAYNAVAPHPVSNKEITTQIAKVLKRPLWLPNVPSFVLHIVVGEMAAIVLNGAVISGEKIQNTGFQFQFPEVDKALENLLRR